MNFIIDIIKEYLLILKNHTLFFLVRNTPEKWSNGEKGTILLIPGFFGIWHDMKTLGDNLNHEGYKIMTIDVLNFNLHSVYEGALKLQSFLKTNNLTNLIVIGHSKGGLVVRKAIEDQESMARIKQVFTVCTPHHGTIYGHFRIVYLSELIPDGRLCKDLQEHSEYNSRIINIMPKFDNHIMPNKNAILENANNITIPIIGHTRILETKELADTILKYL